MGDGNLKQGDEERDVPRRHGPGGPPRTVIKAAMQYSHEQGLTPRVLNAPGDLRADLTRQLGESYGTS